MSEDNKQEMTPEEREREYQRRYYEQRKERIRAHRRKKYQEDKEFREKARARSKRQYWFKTRPERQERAKKGVELTQVEPAGTVSVVVENPEDERHGQTVEVPVYTTAAVAQVIGRSPQTIRSWEKNGVVPEPQFRARSLGAKVAKGRNPRLYTEDELRVLEQCREMLRVPYTRLTESAFSKCVHERFKALVQGLEPRPRAAAD